MALYSLIPLRLIAMADAAEEGEGWLEAYLAKLADEDPMMELAGEDASWAFKLEASGWPPPAQWTARGSFECLERDRMLRALYWFLPGVPKYALTDLRRHGFTTKNPDKPTCPHFTLENREALLRMLPIWNKFTMPIPQTPEEYAFN